MTNSLLTFLLLLPFTLSNSFRHVHSDQNQSIEDKLLKKVGDLYEVKQFMITAKASKPALMVARVPDKDFKYYWIKVGLSNFDQFRTTYDFYVEPKTLKISYLDLMIDDGNNRTAIITLWQWRHFRRHPAFKKMHYYRNGKIIASG